ncbi:hypothetical protein [Parabacteroides sp. FAFU027]|uniref:hypothetical protein n=1 Tax=Parabacteroides sp. FAFU027 TaxID=2922715 RepID=UPI001FB02B3C|nr:hypothetical protein [Parabacteroides sp. FAFU027]
MQKLTIDSTDGFLHLADLPHNCIFNKVVTGCGGTTIVLTNNEYYVVVVPTTELIINKCESCQPGLSPTKNLFGLYGEFTYQLKKKLNDYISTPGVKKIMCTYDKLSRLSEYLNPADYRILIDEYHSLLKAYSFRDEAIDGVLDSFRAYKSYCFMSATPICAEFKPSVLEDIPEIIAEWESTVTLKVRLEQTNKPYVKAANIINTYKKEGYITIDGIKSYEAFFFINSVTDIKGILDHCNLTDEEVRIVCANNEKNKAKLGGYKISSSIDKNKMFNFITSKSFEGADYHSETGMCFVVSSASNPHTLASIDTDIPQIAGRIRTITNPFRKMIVHIFNSNKSDLNLSYEEVVERTQKGIKDARDTASHFNNAPENVKAKLRTDLKAKLNEMYMSYNRTEDKFVVNDILPKLELYNYKVNQIIYSSGIALSKAYNENGAMTTNVNWETITTTLDKNATAKLSFKDAFIRFAELQNTYTFSNEADQISSIQPLVSPAYHKLGIEKVRSLRYVKKEIEDCLKSLDVTKNVDSKIAAILSTRISTGFKSNKDLKTIIQDAYNKVGVKQTAKATDISKWFDCEDGSKRIDNKKVNGYNVYRCRTIFKTN